MAKQRKTTTIYGALTRIVLSKGGTFKADDIATDYTEGLKTYLRKLARKGLLVRKIGRPAIYKVKRYGARNEIL